MWRFCFGLRGGGGGVVQGFFFLCVCGCGWFCMGVGDVVGVLVWFCVFGGGVCFCFGVFVLVFLF